jgi:hypothetical protein
VGLKKGGIAKEVFSHFLEFCHLMSLMRAYAYEYSKPKEAVNEQPAVICMAANPREVQTPATVMMIVTPSHKSPIQSQVESLYKSRRSEYKYMPVSLNNK